MPQTFISGREATENVPASRRVRDVDNDINYLDPDAAPFTLIMQKSGTRTVVNSKFEWIESEATQPTKLTTVSGAVTNIATTVIVAAGSGVRFSIRDVVENLRTAEKFVVTGIATDTLTVVRAVDGDGVTGLAMNNGDSLLIVGVAFGEGTASPIEKSVVETYPFNYTQIHKLSFGVTGTESVSENYTGPDRTRLRKEKAVEHRVQLERTALFGERNLFTAGDGSAAAPVRYAGGFFYYFGTAANVQDFLGTVTEAELETWLQAVFQHTASSDTRLLLASPLWISIFDQLAMGRIQTVPKQDVFGLTVRQWITSHGTLMIVKHRLLENGADGFGYGGHALAVDMSRVKYCPLRERNTKLETNIQAPDEDRIKDQYKTEAGYQFEVPLLHGVGKGATG